MILNSCWGLGLEPKLPAQKASMLTTTVLAGLEANVAGMFSYDCGKMLILI